jgi:hypothetical protein
LREGEKEYDKKKKSCIENNIIGNGIRSGKEKKK